MKNSLFMIPAACLLLAGCGDAKTEAARTASASPVEIKFSDDIGDDCCSLDKKMSSGVPAGHDFDEYLADVKRILPEFSAFGTRKGREVELLDKDGKNIGSLRTAPDKYERTEGYNDVINTAVVLKDGRIAGVALGKNSETPRFLKRVRQGGLLEKWNGKTLSEAADMEVDAVTSATYSSDAIKSEVKAIAE